MPTHWVLFLWILLFLFACIGFLLAWKLEHYKKENTDNIGHVYAEESFERFSEGWFVAFGCITFFVLAFITLILLMLFS